MNTKWLKFLHIRRSHRDCRTPRIDWVLGPVRRTEYPDASTLALDIDEFPLPREMQPEIVEFVRWAFGPHGLHALKLIAYGNFEESDLPGRSERFSIDHRLFFSRVKNGREYRCSDILTGEANLDRMLFEDDEIFQRFSRGKTGFDDFALEYGDLLKACPENLPKNWE